MNRKLEIFESVLTSPFNNDSFVGFVREFLNNVELIASTKYNKEYSNFSFYVDGYYHIGNYISDDNDKIAIFSVCLNRGDTVERARSMQRNFVKPLIEKGGCAGALVAFFTKDDPDKWRLSFIRMDYEFSMGKVKEKLTPAKRYSYLVGKGEPCHTAKQRLYPIFMDDNTNPGIDELEEAFSVEKVTNEFFNLYKEKYIQLKEYLESNEEFMNEATYRNFTSEQFAKKLMGQIVFLYFIQKKGWLGVEAIPITMTEKQYKNAFFARGTKSREIVPKVYVQQPDGTYRIAFSELQALSDEDEEFLAGIVKGKPWGSGPKDFMRKIFDGCVDAGKNYFDDYLEPLFYTGLNKKRGENGFYAPLHRRIPFLNGGLFEQLDNYEWENNNFAIPNELFSNKTEKGRDADGILDIFDRYNFTMNEDEPMEREVAIDPEMLGKVFENLLDVTDRKSKGAFYTPREIVHYMCQETLINHLVTKTGIPEADIREFILYGDLMKDEDTTKDAREGNKDMFISANIYNSIAGVNRLKELDDILANVKVADLAVGSGAFPLGMLNEIVKARETLSAYMSIGMNAFQKKSFYAYDRKPYDLKVNTIKNCIFACDIEPSAVDIAKLRLWLSIVIDDEITEDAGNGDFDAHSKPRQLPNLDCNIICGNSLIQQFKGIQLITESTLLNNESEDRQQSLFQAGVDSMISRLIELQDKLYFTKEHNDKEEIKSEIQHIYDDIILEQIKGNPELENSYYELQNETSKPFILWQLYFPKVFRDNGGFDIIIGNPPYFNVQTLGAKSEIVDYLKKDYKEIWMDKSDILFYFIYLGYLLSNDQVCFITSNAFLFSDKGKKLRNFIVEKMPIESIINFENYMVFDSASITSCITNFRKGRDIRKAKAKTISDNSLDLNAVLRNRDLEFEVEFERNDFFALIPPEIKALDKKIKENHVNLGDLLKVGKGMETAANNVFLFDECPVFPKEYVRRRITGDMIERYHIGEPSQYLLYYEHISNYNELDLSVRQHLEKNREFLENRATVKNEGRDWWKYSRPMHKEYYGFDKIWCSYRSTKNRFALDTTKNYIGFTNTTVIFDTNPDISILYVLALVNSELLEYQHKNSAKQTGGGVYEYFPNTIERYPIPVISIEEQKPFIEIVEKIIEIKKNNANESTIELEQQIDELVYSLYNITEDEKKIIKDKIRR